MKQTEAAYFAGLLDGEGTISLRKVPQPKCSRGWNWRPLVQIANSDFAMLETVARITECHWTWGKHYYKGKRLPAGVWRTTGSAAIKTCLSQALPFLVTKEKHAILLLEACDLILSLPKGKNTKNYEKLFAKICPRLIQIHTKLAALNQRGARWRNPNN